MGDEDEEIVKEIKLLEGRLRALRVSLEKKKEKKEKSGGPLALKVGDIVRIKNPKKDQESTGRVSRINPESGYHTIETRTQSIKRFAKNLEKISE